jgi:hypothetical protein
MHSERESSSSPRRRHGAKRAAGTQCRRKPAAQRTHQLAAGVVGVMVVDRLQLLCGPAVQRVRQLRGVRSEERQRQVLSIAGSG